MPYVSSVAWSADGRLASGSYNNIIKIARADLLLGGNTCNVIFRNMTIREWIDYQGWLYIYQPACPNLYNPIPKQEQLLQPVFDVSRSIKATLDDSIYSHTIELHFEGIDNYDLFTWQGRMTLFIFLLILISAFSISVRLFYRSATWLWHRTRSKRGIQT